MIELMVSLTVVVAVGIAVAVVLDIRSDHAAAEMEKAERQALQSIARTQN